MNTMVRRHQWKLGSSKSITYWPHSKRVIFHYKRFFINFRPRVFQRWCKLVRRIKASPSKRFNHYLGANIYAQYQSNRLRVIQQHSRHQPIYFLLVHREWLDYLACVHKHLLHLCHVHLSHRQRFLADESKRTD